MVSGRAVSAEFLADDLREIRRLLAQGTVEPEGPARLLHDVIATYRRDEAAWQEVEHQHDAASEATQVELKRRETGALLVSMRARTIRSEIEMHELRERVRALQERHTEQRERARTLQEGAARLRRRIGQVQEALARGAAANPNGKRTGNSVRQVLAGFWRRNG
jgi:hypothetical protein